MQIPKYYFLGAGGAARAIVTAFAKEKAGKITIANRTLKKGNELSQFAHKIGIEANAISLDEIKESASDYDIIVNATSVGLNNEPSPISTETISENSIVYDIVYKPNQY